MKPFIDILNQGGFNTELLQPCDLEAIRKACVSRGKRRGLLKTNCPTYYGANRDEEAFLAWQGLISNVAPVRTSIFGLMGRDDDGLFDRIERQFDAKLYPNNFHLLNATGQRPLEFNLYAHRYNIHKVYSTCVNANLQEQSNASQ